MKVIIGNDHSSVEYKFKIIDYLEKKGIEVINIGINENKSVDYPDIAKDLSHKLLDDKEISFGILLCGTGIGISIAANKVKGIRAALITEELSARLSKQHNNANIICFGGRTMGIELIYSCIDSYMNATFEEGRHERRVCKIGDIKWVYLKKLLIENFQQQ